MCSTVSTCAKQIGHAGKQLQPRRDKFSCVARAFEQAFHQKYLIFGSVFRFQICFQKLLFGVDDEEAKV
ncbi:hypothetical protein Tco_0350821, partial [Tanacetum coccineum]